MWPLTIKMTSQQEMEVKQIISSGMDRMMVAVFKNSCKGSKMKYSERLMYFGRRAKYSLICLPPYFQHFPNNAWQVCNTRVRQKSKKINFKSKCNKRSLKDNMSPVIPGSLEPLFNVECQVPQILKGSFDISRRKCIEKGTSLTMKSEGKKPRNKYSGNTAPHSRLWWIQDRRCLPFGAFAHLRFTERFSLWWLWYPESGPPKMCAPQSLEPVKVLYTKGTLQMWWNDGSWAEKMILAYLGGSDAMTRVLTRGRQKRRFTALALVAEEAPRAKEHRRPLEAGKRQGKRLVLRVSSRNAAPWGHFGFLRSRTGR